MAAQALLVRLAAEARVAGAGRKVPGELIDRGLAVRERVVLCLTAAGRFAAQFVCEVVSPP